jgi:hypothetical protein
MKQFYQADVAESSSGSIWTGPLVYTASIEEAEFLTMLELQADWGDGYMPDEFIAMFGSAEEATRPESIDFPGDDTWNTLGFWDAISGEGEVTSGMLTVPPIEALAQLGKIDCNLSEEDIDRIMMGTMRASLQLTKGD